MRDALDQWINGMPCDFISVLTPAATLFGGAFVASFVTHIATKRRDRHTLLQKKAEELYLATHELSQNFSIRMAYCLNFFNNDFGYQHMINSQESEANQNEHGGSVTMTMLVDIYFPELRETLDRLLKSNAAHRAFRVLLSEDISNDTVADKDGWRKKAMAIVKVMEQEVESLKAEIVKAARAESGVERRALKLWWKKA